MAVLTCKTCNQTFEHKARGRRPHKCPACREGVPTTTELKAVAEAAATPEELVAALNTPA